MIYKRFGNPHVKLWNKELLKLFEFSSLNVDKQEEDESCKDQQDASQIIEKQLERDKLKKIEDLDQSHLKDVMNKKVLLPIAKIVEDWENNEQDRAFENPVLQRKPISIETALIFGESDRFYNVIDPEKAGTETAEDMDFPSN